MFKLAKLDKIFSILLFAAVPIGLYFSMHLLKELWE